MTHGSHLPNRRELVIIAVLLAFVVLLDIVPLFLYMVMGVEVVPARMMAVVAYIPFAAAFIYVHRRLHHLTLLHRIIFVTLVTMPAARLVQTLLVILVPEPGADGPVLPKMAWITLEMIGMVGIAVLFGALLVALLLADRIQSRLHDLIEDRRRAEEEVRTQAAEMRKMAMEADRANRAKSEFIAHISHELRTPFNGVLGMTELALDHCESAEQHDYLLGARQSARSLLALIDNLLDMSKVEAGKLELEERPFSPGALARELVSALQPLAGEKKLVLGLELAGNLPAAVVGDPLRMRQVLTNLLGNALRYTDAGSVHLELAAGVATDDLHRIIYIVRDTGIGIPAERLDSIFEPFTQADRDTSTRGGTGLGLSISDRIVRLMGGELEVESRMGEGSVFRFILDHSVPEGGTVESRESSEAVASELPPLRILVAEDNPVNRIVATKLLERDGHRVTEAKDGKEVLERVDEHHDLVLMDIRMPLMDGIEATLALREREQGTGRRVPVVALTASAFPEDRKRSLEAGMDAFLSKPISRDALRTCLAESVRYSSSEPVT